MANISVTGRAELIAALSAAAGGDTIILARGDYGSLRITHDYSSTVTLRSVTPKAATFSDLAFSGASNIRVDGVHVANSGNGGISTSLIDIDDGSHHISVVNSEVNGHIDSNYGGWQGIFIRDAEHVLIQNNDIHDVFRGMVNHGPAHLDVVGNRFKDLGDDTMKFSGVSDVRIENNFSSGPVRNGSHLDYIQFQGDLARVSSDIVIKGNVFLADTVANVQGVFLKSTIENALIENNVVHTSMGNGVFVQAGHGITVRDNTILNVVGAGNPVSNIRTPAGSEVENNITSSWAGARNTGIKNGNLIVQNTDPNAPNYVTDYYSNANKGIGLTVDDLSIVRGSLAASMGAYGRLGELLGGSRPAPSPAPAPAPAPPASSSVIWSSAGAHEFASAADVTNVAHAGRFAVPAATIAFSFDADSVSGIRGLLTKDALGYEGGGNHFAAYLKNGSLAVMFESGDARKTFTVQNIKANQEYDVQASFGDGKVSAWLDGKLIGSASFVTDWSVNREYLQVGAHGGWSASRASDFTHVFDGTISDVRIVTGALNPAQMAPPPGSAAAPPGADLDPVFSRMGDSEFTGRTAGIAKVAHSAALEIDAGSISFTFDADTVGIHQGILSKDAGGYTGGGNHFAAWLEGDVLKFRFEDESRQTVFQMNGIKANQDYDVLAVFDADEVGLYVNDALIGKRAFSIDLGENHQVLQIGGWDGPGTADDPFDGTISDVMIFDQVLAPDDIALL